MTKISNRLPAHLLAKILKLHPPSPPITILFIIFKYIVIAGAEIISTAPFRTVNLTRA